MAEYRVGIGYDLHRLVQGRPLWLGGVEVPFERGLLGHSDGDVLLHAVTDALLGACGLPDLGEFFPDTDVKYKDVHSAELLLEAYRKADCAGFVPRNVDCVIHAEKPLLSPYKQKIAHRIASLLSLEPRCVSVKAKTNEGIGDIGTGKAIAATAVIMVENLY